MLAQSSKNTGDFAFLMISAGLLYVSCMKGSFNHVKKKPLNSYLFSNHVEAYSQNELDQLNLTVYMLALILGTTLKPTMRDELVYVKGSKINIATAQRTCCSGIRSVL